MKWQALQVSRAGLSCLIPLSEKKALSPIFKDKSLMVTTIHLPPFHQKLLQYMYIYYWHYIAQYMQINYSNCPVSPCKKFKYYIKQSLTICTEAIPGYSSGFQLVSGIFHRCFTVYRPVSF